MPLFREENFLLVHVGSHETRVLFGLHESLAPPKISLPTVVYHDQATSQYRASNPAGEYAEIHPVVGSRVADMGGLKALLKFVLQLVIRKNPVLTINQIPMLLLTPSVSLSREAVEDLTRFVFETLELPAFNVLDLSVAASYGLGSTASAVVVNVGHEATQIVPVLGGLPLKYAARRLPVGGRTIDDELRKILPQFSAPQLAALKHSPIYEVMVDHEDSFYSHADLSEEKQGDGDADIDIAKIVSEGNGAPGALAPAEAAEGKPNCELQTNSFSFEGQMLSVGKERFQGAQRLVAALAEGIFASLAQVPDLDKRQECYDNLVLVGGTTNIAGLKQAVVLELCRRHVARPPPPKGSRREPAGVSSAILAYQLTSDMPEPAGDHSGGAQVPSSVKLIKYPEYFPAWKQPKERGGSWSEVYFLGAQIYAKQIYGANSNYGGDSFMDAEIYDERGPQAIWDVSL
ncbi:actin-like ATPase domain-containing protein [Metschnikowia bicuspidata var. bicuspidata NRRL YB-4993]|uniref:Actin-like ATPase domain-containing protein n=1 Tax=Metschnikowia bicuspidata var. bicuspidata NRRL YB-4993 TaxID=869754 RepID=A0A1A0HFN5_9ASCO|nr:actin-like ATPase domain-containing protein [Metschnikowia bicuspidata var. bicuspidata NRRL YB-4993]OBA22707.1 actin-like ATPase domain-containing protein [Metschnikowia bicuspidata var. bicuspidata NRRL YB-4993]